MIDTGEKDGNNFTYKQAMQVADQGSKLPDTSVTTPSTTATVVPQKGDIIQIRIVPRLPRQRGEQARTDKI